VPLELWKHENPERPDRWLKRFFWSFPLLIRKQWSMVERTITQNKHRIIINCIVSRDNFPYGSRLCARVGSAIEITFKDKVRMQGFEGSWQYG
jgi:hypothetical protein